MNLRNLLFDSDIWHDAGGTFTCKKRKKEKKWYSHYFLDSQICRFTLMLGHGGSRVGWWDFIRNLIVGS